MPPKTPAANHLCNINDGATKLPRDKAFNEIDVPMQKNLTIYTNHCGFSM